MLGGARQETKFSVPLIKYLSCPRQNFLTIFPGITVADGVPVFSIIIVIILFHIGAAPVMPDASA